MVVVARIKARPEAAEEVAVILRGLIPEVRKEKDTLVYILNRSQRDPSLFLFYEKYADAEALVAHSSTDHFKKSFKAMNPLLAEPPVIEMYDELDAK